MKIIDLSQPLFDGCPNCPVHPPVRIEITGSHAKDGPEGWHMEHLSFTSHTGSHVDAPLHKLQGGDSLDAFPLECWTGPARVVDFRGAAADARITAEMLSSRLPASIRDEWILLATGFGDKRAKSQEWLHHPPVLAADGARWLVEKGARGVGIDHFSIGDAETHSILLGKPVLIVEELHFPSEVYALSQAVLFMALPIHLKSASGAPCRPVLVI
ncbi:MAG TPA: cyclase family protein [Phycisphaerae bacterium]|jgi:kynurenine formamidase|nr:cyclase family protein [Phycisphaerae bacterium]